MLQKLNYQIVNIKIALFLQFSKINKYEKKRFEHFKKLRNHDDCRIRYVICYGNIKVFYYYDDDELFDINKDIDILRQFLKRCKFDITVGILQLKLE